MQATAKLEITIDAVGQAAWQLIQHNGPVAVLGVTSKGAFLQTPSRDVCFLSVEAWRGPLTLNLRQRVGLKTRLPVGTRGQVSGRGVEFPACRVVVPEEAAVWAAEPISKEHFDLHQSLARGAALARQVDTRNSLFQAFFAAAQAKSWAGAEQALLDLAPGKASGLLNRLPDFLGLGGGLTPSGDDLLCGLLLARYYLIETPSAGGLPDLISLARVRTTALSASLIACAAGGQADARLMKALNWLLTGAGEMEIIKKALLIYGSASGSDALAGMLASLVFYDK